MKKVGIIGASGYTGYELIKLLLKHPGVELKVLNSKTYNGKQVKELYPDFEGNLNYTNYSIDEINNMKLDCIFLAVPHTTAFLLVPQIKAKKIIDLSADYRFNKKEKYEDVYGVKRSDSKKAVYGLPELFKEKINKAKLVANPGCYATACILAAFPIQKLAKYIVFDCVSGWSGAGKSSKFAENHNTIKENFVAYKLVKHRHKPEIEQFVKTKLSFTPHVTDAYQGMMCTAHILLKKDVDAGEIKKAFKDYYKGQPFIEITDEIPDIKQAAKTNKCIIGGFEVDDNNQLVIVSVIDNLIKGASGQAVQNMNLMFKFKETEGL